MNNILVLNSSLSGPESVTGRLLDEAVALLRARHPQAVIVRRDLARDPIPHLTPDTVAGIRAQASTPDERRSSELSDTLIAELKAADVVVIGAPMYNFGVPTTLRSWFDHVLRPRVTFGYGENGPKGLVADKPVIVIEARGGLYSEGPATALDFQEPYLKQLLGFMGLADVRFVRAERIGHGPDARAAAIEAAMATLRDVLPGELRAA